MSMSLTHPATELQGTDALRQSIGLYFTTPKGSIPLHPHLGFAIFNYVDRNINSVLKLIREVRTGIALWDNRITIISAVPLFGVGKLTMRVVWMPSNDSSNIITSNFDL